MASGPARTTPLNQRASSQQLRRLVEKAQEGDRDALEELYLLHFDRIYSYLHMSAATVTTPRTCDAGLRQDARVDRQVPVALGAVLCLALPDRPQPGDGSFRASKRWQPEEEVPEPDPGEESAAEEEALESIGRQSMLELIEKLSREQQQVLTLKFVFNFSNADAATILDKTDGAIKSLQHRALASLQRQLSGSAP